KYNLGDDRFPSSAQNVVSVAARWRVTEFIKEIAVEDIDWSVDRTVAAVIGYARVMPEHAGARRRHGLTFNANRCQVERDGTIYDVLPSRDDTARRPIIALRGIALIQKIGCRLPSTPVLFVGQAPSCWVIHLCRRQCAIGLRQWMASTVTDGSEVID